MLDRYSAVADKTRRQGRSGNGGRSVLTGRLCFARRTLVNGQARIEQMHAHLIFKQHLGDKIVLFVTEYRGRLHKGNQGLREYS